VPDDRGWLKRKASCWRRICLISASQQLDNSLNPDGILLLGAAERLPGGLDANLRQISSGRTIGYLKVR